VSRKILVDDDAAQYDNLQRRLRRLEQGAGARPRASGQVTFTWPGGGDLSDTMTVAHGLGATPQAVSSSNEPALNVAVVTTDATNITLRARDITGSTHGAGTFGVARWIAVL
jgi:hypothetical protein